MATAYRIKEFSSTVLCTEYDDVTLVVSKSFVREKTNAYVFNVGKLGVVLANAENDNYNNFSIGNYANLTLENIIGTITTIADWVDIHACVEDLNSLLQLNVNLGSTAITLDQQDVEIVEMCDVHGCGDPKAVIKYDGGGSTNVMGLTTPTYDGVAATIERVDWGDGTVEDFASVSACSHTYASNLNPSTITLRAIVKNAAELYSVVYGSFTLDAGAATTGEFTFNQDLTLKFKKFLRHFIYLSDGGIDTYIDTDLIGNPYVASDFVKESCCDCDIDTFYSFQVVDNNIEKIDIVGTTTLPAGKYNGIFITVISATTGVVINGDAQPLGFGFNYDNNNQRYRSAITITTDAANGVILTTYRNVNL